MDTRDGEHIPSSPTVIGLHHMWGGWGREVGGGGGDGLSMVFN